MDWRLLRNARFFFYCVSSALTSTAIIMVFTFEESRDKENEFSAGVGSNLITTLGASNMIWRILLGAVTLVPHVNLHAINGIAHCIGGAAAIASGFATNLPSLYIYAAFFGLALGSYAVYRPIILMEIVGADKLANGTGISLLFMGVVAVAGPPFGGWLYVQTNSYKIIYWTSGCMFILAGLILACITRWRTSRSIRTTSV